jgi:putative transposase
MFVLNRQHRFPSGVDLLAAKDPTRVDELWVGDITYLPLRRGGFCYLAALMDCF